MSHGAKIVRPQAVYESTLLIYFLKSARGQARKGAEIRPVHESSL
jgi:hypothetical protein